MSVFFLIRCNLCYRALFFVCPSVEINMPVSIIWRTILNKSEFESSKSIHDDESDTTRLVHYCSWGKGGKPAYIAYAGKCLVACGERNNRAVIVVVLGSTNLKVWEKALITCSGRRAHDFPACYWVENELECGCVVVYVY